MAASSPERAAKPVVLCVDDEPDILQGLTLHLRRAYDVRTAAGGAEGLAILKTDSTVAVILSDMRMPGMDGAQFLSRARELAPDATRVLLTGYADLDSAMAVINQAPVFRFLTKPCAPSFLVGTIEAAVAQHRLVTSERVLLEQTLRGCVAALTDVVAVANPAAFGRAQQLRERVAAIAGRLELAPCWQLDVAAMLCHIGAVALPADVADRFYAGRPLSIVETEMVARVPRLAEQLLAHIPRLEAIVEILRQRQQPFAPIAPGRSPTAALMHRAGEVLKAAADAQDLEFRGRTPSAALKALRNRADRYDPAVLAAMADDAADDTRRTEELRPIPVAALLPGMVLDEDLRLESGLLLAARGAVVTAAFAERARNARLEGVVRVALTGTRSPSAA